MSIGEIAYNIIKLFFPQIPLPAWNLLPTGTSGDDLDCGIGYTQSFWVKQASTFATWELQKLFAQGEINVSMTTKRNAGLAKFSKCVCCGTSANANLFPACADNLP